MAQGGDNDRRAYECPVLVRYGSVRNLTGGSSNVGNDRPFPAGKNTGSDLRLKENIVRIGEHPQGFGIYLFDYKEEFRSSEGNGRQFGVMAQEVAPIIPEAVVTDANGIMRVDYARLGITRH